MFGRQDGQTQDNNQIPQQTIDNAIAAENAQPAANPSAPPLPADGNWQHPGAPIDGHAATVNPAPIAPQPAAAPAAPVPVAATPVAPQPAAHDGGDLLQIKQQALTQLSPLLGHLEQSPEERFRTTMMMIQASDDQSLISTAYSAAKSISDEKTRAQALLDVVNEINYFTQNLPQAA
jgi:hypothetical protein